MKKEYISIKEACDVSKKSLSTIRRFVSETKKIAPKKLKYETLTNGTKKILIDFDYLNEYFNQTTYSNDSQMNDSQGSQMSNSNEDTINVLKSALDTLKSELDAKNNHINMLLERQRETNIMIEGLNQRFLIETKEVNDTREVKKKWWKRNK
jgi:predicted  nucleic acid-binding Zn-ribbon protein